MTNAKPTTVDEYIAAFPANVQIILQQVRRAIRQAAPNMQETISYAMPAYKLHGNLVYFAAFKNHIGFYAIPSGHQAFEKELSVYKSGKGSVQFPLNKPMPLNLITQIVEFRVNENIEMAKAKK